tara:strand:+ start:828 stop:1937 length:1110 start_codon:yes stop_codon:yes gene_type:complete
MKFIKQIEPYFDKQELKSVTRTLKSTFITEGNETKKFEKLVSKKIKAKNVIALSNWTLGLYSCAKALGFKSGDEIIVPNLTFVSCVTSMLMAGLKVKLCEVNSSNYSLDLAHAKKLLSKKTKAIMIVHLFGECSDIPRILSFAKKNKLKVIEDAAQSFGGKFKNRYLGTYGDIGGFSFYGNKTITTGEGGVAVCKSKKYADKIKRLKNYGRLTKGSYKHEEIGYNFKFNDLAASIGVSQINKFNTIIKKKKFIDNFYRKNLKNIKQIKFSKKLRHSNPVYWFTSIQAIKKKKLKIFLKKKNIETRDFFYPMHLQKCFVNIKEVISEKSFYENSLKHYKNGLCLPSSANLNLHQLNYIVKNIKNFYEFRN